MTHHHLPHIFPLLLSSVLVLASGNAANAQQVYRIVGPDGKVSFSDRPPANADARSTTAVGTSAANMQGNPPLPLELRDAVSNYPVTLYTGPGCQPCSAGRAMLVQRGVPFTERTVSTNEDVLALQRISGAGTLPFATIGGQQFKGFSDVEWGQYLDAAGYPASNKLPSAYRNPAPTPLVAVAKPAAAASGDGAATRNNGSTAPRAPAAPSPAAEANPAGIRF